MSRRATASELFELLRYHSTYIQDMLKEPDAYFLYQPTGEGYV
jgi:hypothetical protein